MPLPNITSGSAKRCKARAKHTGEQCKNLAVKNWTVCRFHGYNPHVVRGDQHHWFKHGEETAAVRREMPAINKRLKELGKALLTGNYDDLPFDPKLEKLKAEYAAVLKKQGVDLSPKPKAPIRTLAEARAAIKPKPKYIPSPAQRAKVAAYQKVYQPKYRAKQKALKSEAKREAEQKCQAYLKQTKEK
jgi:hypothetical protein